MEVVRRKLRLSEQHPIKPRTAKRGKGYWFVARYGEERAERIDRSALSSSVGIQDRKVLSLYLNDKAENAKKNKRLYRRHNRPKFAWGVQPGGRNHESAKNRQSTLNALFS